MSGVNVPSASGARAEQGPEMRSRPSARRLIAHLGPIPEVISAPESS